MLYGYRIHDIAFSTLLSRLLRHYQFYFLRHTRTLRVTFDHIRSKYALYMCHTKIVQLETIFGCESMIYFSTIKPMLLIIYGTSELCG